MFDHDRYVVDINIKGKLFRMFVAVPKEIPEDYVDDFVQNEVFDYLKSIVRYTYSLKLL